MRVDEAGRDDLTARIDGSGSGGAARAPDIHDAVARNLDIAGDRRGVGAGIDGAAADDDIDSLLRGRCPDRQQRQSGKPDPPHHGAGASVVRDFAAASTRARLNSNGCICSFTQGR
jgi:hypothetical protein